MENAFDAMRSAVRQAREVNQAVDMQTNAMVDLLEGRLETVSPFRLARLKKALQRFNSRTNEWRPE
jgi:hypothetical protein